MQAFYLAKIKEMSFAGQGKQVKEGIQIPKIARGISSLYSVIWQYLQKHASRKDLYKSASGWNLSREVSPQNYTSVIHGFKEHVKT